MLDASGLAPEGEAEGGQTWGNAAQGTGGSRRRGRSGAHRSLAFASLMVTPLGMAGAPPTLHALCMLSGGSLGRHTSPETNKNQNKNKNNFNSN